MQYLSSHDMKGMVTSGTILVCFLRQHSSVKFSKPLLLFMFLSEQLINATLEGYKTGWRDGSVVRGVYCSAGI